MDGSSKSTAPRKFGCGRRGLASLALPALALGTGSRTASAQATAIRGRDGWLFFPWDNPARVSLTGIPRVTGLLVEAAEMLRTAGIATCLAVVPSKFRIYRDRLAPDQVFDSAAEQRLSVVLAELRKGRSIVPDLGALLLAHRRNHPQDTLFFRADTHWTPLGAALSAHEVARLVRGAGILPAASAPGMRLGPPTTRMRARQDLLDLIPASERAAYAPEPYVIRPAQPARGGLLDAPPSDVAVLGTSFVAPEFNFHAELSAALDRPVALEWKIQTVGPYSVLLQYLRGPLFRRERPRLIVLVLLEGAMAIGPENRTAYPADAMSAADFIGGVRQALESAARPGAAPARRGAP